MNVRLAILSDLQFAAERFLGTARGDLAELLLLRLIKRLQRQVHPHAVIVLGNLLHDGAGGDRHRLWSRLKHELDALRCPVLVLPGPRDGNSPELQRVFPRPPEWLDVGHLRIVPFVDRCDASGTPRRSVLDMLRLGPARSSHRGPLVAVQWAPLRPLAEGEPAPPGTLSNAATALSEMALAGVRLVLGSGGREGFVVERQDTTYVGCPAFAEHPFGYRVVCLDGNAVSVHRESLAMPEGLRLLDLHSHSEFAYCSQNMDLQVSPVLAGLFGMQTLALTEHSGQLYFNRNDYWGGTVFARGVRGSNPAEHRMEQYLQTTAAHPHDRLAVALEVDADFDGNPVLRPEDRRRVRLILGAVHQLPALAAAERPPPEAIYAEFMAINERFLRQGIHVLAHPYRVLRRAGLDVPDRLIPPLVRLLKENGVHAEINYNGDSPSPEFVRQCVQAGVKLTLGSDSHNLAHVGDLEPHLALLREAGYSEADLPGILAFPNGLP